MFQLKGLLFFSSSEIYGDPAPEAIPTNESYRGNVACLGPRACYDEAKRFGETLCWVFANTLGTPIRIVRPFNNYGPGMALTDSRAPADFGQCVMQNRDITIFSSGAPTRTFCYVADAVAGYFKALLHDRFDAFNIGIEKPEISVRELAEQLLVRRVRFEEAYEMVERGEITDSMSVAGILKVKLMLVTGQLKS